MIISVSRRTDIPACYAPWFFHRLRAGFADVPNPLNPHAVSRVSLLEQDAECFIFWSKNPAPMLPRLGEMGSRPFYFQLTLTGYGPDVEPGLPPAQDRVDTLLRLAECIGPHRVIWRYDPVLLGGPYTPEGHLERFAGLCGQLKDSTRRCVISFLDEYTSVKPVLARAGLYRPGLLEMRKLAQGFGTLAAEHGLTVEACAEGEDWSAYGIRPGCCIDPVLVRELTGRPPEPVKAARLRTNCGCWPSVDIGCYGTCPQGCLYCYASRGSQRAAQAFRQHHPEDTMLVGNPGPGDRITPRPAGRKNSQQQTLL